MRGELDVNLQSRFVEVGNAFLSHGGNASGERIWSSLLYTLQQLPPSSLSSLLETRGVSSDSNLNPFSRPFFPYYSALLKCR
jgi:hypothetical protein